MIGLADKFTDGKPVVVLPFNASDGMAIYRWYHDPRYAHYFRGYTYGVTPLQCEHATQLLKADILIGVSETEARVGMVSLAEQSHVIRVYKFGLLVDVDYQRVGVGKILTEAALTWAFDTMNAHKVYAEVLECDKHIIDGALKLGFKREGLLRKSQFVHGEFKNEIIIGILQEDYRKSRMV